MGKGMEIGIIRSVYLLTGMWCKVDSFMHRLVRTIQLFIREGICKF